MSFKYSFIGDNSPENREWLEKIGYRVQITFPFPYFIMQMATRCYSAITDTSNLLSNLPMHNLNVHRMNENHPHAESL